MIDHDYKNLRKDNNKLRNALMMTASLCICIGFTEIRDFSAGTIVQTTERTKN